MKILSIEIQNFKPFRSLQLPDDGSDLPDGLIIIKGPNSTGKSSLFEAILWALWGSSAVRLKNEELISFSSSFCKVILVFEVAGIRYKIDRSYDPANGMSVVLYIRKKTSWKRIADKSQSVTGKLEEILNIELNQAESTLMVKQGEVGEIANATPTTLRNLIVKVYNIELLDQMTGQLSGLESDLDIRINALESDYVNPERIEKEIADATSRIKQYQESLKERTKEINETEKLLKSLPQSDDLAAVSEVVKKLERLERDYEQAQKRRNKDLIDAGIPEAGTEVIEARSESLEKRIKKTEDERKQKQKQISKIDLEIGAINGTERDLKRKIRTLEEAACEDPESTECPTCSNPLSPEEREKIVAEYASTIDTGIDKIKEYKERRKKLESEIRSIDEKLRVSNKALDAVNRAKQQNQEIEEAKDKLDATKKEFSELCKKMKIKSIESLLEKHSAQTISELERKIAVLGTTLRSAKKDCETVSKNIEQEYQKIEELKQEIVLMEKIGAEIESLKQLSDHTKYVRRKLVNGFIADYAVQKRLIGIIRGATNPYVRAFTNDQYTSIDLDSTPATGRSGAGLALKIWDERDKASKKTVQLSYGDRTAISLGLRLGISKTMSRIRPLKESPAVAPRVRCVMLDEPLGGLDKDRRHSVVSSLENDQGFDQILLITHTDVQDWSGVPSIEIRKSGSGSTAILTRGDA
ncbi:MAG: DNA double-strand break repair Rad50 ATPase [Candidatus Thorarchaeota archaeon]|nr:MAG: DNA double-strand break repair Rad50 ATPase [Candidatus Thorarchaeota archaeon]